MEPARQDSFETILNVITEAHRALVLFTRPEKAIAPFHTKAQADFVDREEVGLESHDLNHRSPLHASCLRASPHDRETVVPDHNDAFGYLHRLRPISEPVDQAHEDATILRKLAD